MLVSPSLVCYKSALTCFSMHALAPESTYEECTAPNLRFDI